MIPIEFYFIVVILQARMFSVYSVLLKVGVVRPSASKITLPLIKNVLIVRRVLGAFDKMFLKLLL